LLYLNGGEWVVGLLLKFFLNNFAFKTAAALWKQAVKVFADLNNLAAWSGSLAVESANPIHHAASSAWKSRASNKKFTPPGGEGFRG
jgi:hypothetical protein